MHGPRGECLPGARPARYFSINYPNFSPRFTLPWRSPQTCGYSRAQGWGFAVRNCASSSNVAVRNRALPCNLAVRNRATNF